MSDIHVRYYVKLKNGEVIVVHSDSERESIFAQSTNESNFFNLPNAIISKSDVSYIKVDGFKV